MPIGHHEPYDAGKGSDREHRTVGAFAKHRDCAIAPRGAGDAKMDASEEDRSEDQKKHSCSPFRFARHFQDARRRGEWCGFYSFAGGRLWKSVFEAVGATLRAKRSTCRSTID